MGFNEAQYQNDERLLDLRLQLDSKLKKYLLSKNDSREEGKPLRDFLREINSLSVSDKKIYQNYVKNIIRGVDDSFIKDTGDDLQQLNKLDMLNAWRGIENNIRDSYQNPNYQQNSNDVYRQQDIVFVGGTIEENVRVLFKGKEKMTSSLNGNITPLGNGFYELELNRIDYDGSDLGEIAKLKLRYNPYGNTVQIINEYNNRIIGEQPINFPRNSYMNRNNSRYPSTNFRINLDHGPAININLAFPNR